ncbi:sensor histidine kinase [Occallatibacter riparius]|uniref:histidine kinase n=1 Tax=Occallatibacter riparius TaxID=1002689 RepID=A0A9J7BKN0_9BACT|nr:ATP-binding protein [Occallatibacter riparius]UWZ83155.1 ATP-binding protein [Occallatibacter riparius]
MRLKTKLVLAITALVLLISGLLSMVYVSQLLHASVQQSYETNRMVADDVRFALQNALQSGLEGRTVDPNQPEQLRDLTRNAIRTSPVLKNVVDAANRYSPTVYDINIGDNELHTLLSTNPDNNDKPLPIRPSYKELLDANPVDLMRRVFGEEPRVYEISVPLERNGSPFATVRVGVRTTFLREVYKPWLEEAFTLMGFALGTAILVALLLSNLALRPLEEISLQLDYWSPSPDGVSSSEPEPQDTAERVSHQIERIGQRIRNVEEVFSALRENIDQILANLQDGLLLFTADSRAVLVSEAARRFLQIDRDRVLGMQSSEIFNRSTTLGRTLREAFDARIALIKEEVRTENGRRIEVSVDFIHDDMTRQGLGALVTLRDLESVEAIESELELSRRMSAIGRLTSGVAHEVKNPINAIVVHLELLRNKLEGTSPNAQRHLDVIEAEIKRLDRVVQTLVDFSRPVELQLREQDLRAIIDDVLALATDELRMRSVTVHSQLPSNPVIVNVDADLLKQAVINVVQNGAQAMPEGGRLDLILEIDRRSAELRILDEGVGIPEEIREKIFDLYFTTKSEGSGIGLAMTYRILQLHHGSVEVQSRRDRGTEFKFRIPLSAVDWGRRPLQAAVIEQDEGLE